MRTNPVVSRLASFLVLALIPLAVAAVPGMPRDLVDVRVSVRPLDLTRPPTTAELMAAGQLGGPLHPTRELPDKARERRANLDFGRAIQAWNDHAYPRAVTLFRRHIRRFPDSPWVAEAKLHIGCDAQYQGRYREARAAFEGLIGELEDSTHPGAVMIVNKTRLRLGGLDVLQYDFAAASEQFRILKAESPDWRHRTYASHWIRRLSQYRANERALLTCGTDALARLLNARGQSVPAHALWQELPAAESGQSIEDLILLASRHGLAIQARHMSPADLARVPLPAIVQLAGSASGKSGHYWVVEEAGGDLLRLFDPQSGRRFRQSTTEFAREWGGVALVASDRAGLPGAPIDPRDQTGTRGGCCGAPAREHDLGDPGPGLPDDCAAPRWRVNVINLNFYASDTPLWFTPPYGPEVRIRLSYNAQSAIAYHEPFGPKWQFNYATYMVIDTGGTVTVFMPDGRRDLYTPDGLGGFTPPPTVHDDLVPVGPDRYELRRLDGTVHVYSMPRLADGGLITQYFLEALRDARGLALTFAYDTDGRLVSITDAPGRVTTLAYNAAGLVSRVADPFGRAADFEYDPDGNLARITDMGGYSSTFTYDADRYITGIDGARGRWQFRTEPADGIAKWSDAYPPPGEPMWQNYRITITNPAGDPFEYFWYGGCDDYWYCAGRTWYVSSRDYVTWRSTEINNFGASVPKTNWWPTTLWVWGKGAVEKVRSPEGRVTHFTYDPDGNVTEVSYDIGNSTTYTYGSRGRMLSMTAPNGSTTTYAYAANGLDVVGITDGRGTISIAYNTAREVTSVTDRLGNTTTATYNALGQLSSITDPLGVVSTFTYGAGAEPEQGVRGGQTIFRRTYDARGRVATHTDATGLTLSVARDDLDRITGVMFPDGLGWTYTYSDCCVAQLLTETDRSGRVTRYAYDALSRLTEVHHPDGSVTHSAYDRNGNVVRRTDPSGRSTRYEYDLDNLLVRRVFADGTAESYRRDYFGSIDRVTNARGQENFYTYDSMHRLTGIQFGDGAPAVAYQYDDFGRLVARQDAVGTASYTYDAESRRTGIDGPFAADSVNLQYDAAGRLTRVAVEGGSPTDYAYDVHGRLQRATHGGGTFTYEYTGSSPLATALTHPSGVRTTYGYDALNRLVEVADRTAELALISSRTYTYDAGSRRTSEAAVGGLPPPAAAGQQTTSEYDAVNALISSVDPVHLYVYDADGNQTRGRTPGGRTFTATYDTENHPTSLEYTDDGGHLRRHEYGYDGDGWLVRIVERTDGAVSRERRFVRGPRLFLQERDGSNAVVAESVWNPGKPGGIGGLLKQRAAGADYSFLYDAAGNVTAVVDAAQAVVASYRYDPFGRVESESGTLAQDFRFQTKFLDPGSGLSYFGFRWATAGDGRWLTRDPLREFGGLNLYTYLGNDPLNRLDAWGLQAQGPGSAPSSMYPFGRYNDTGQVCEGGDVRLAAPDNSWRGFRQVVGSIWGAIFGVAGTDRDSGDNLPNAVAGVRG